MKTTLPATVTWCCAARRISKPPTPNISCHYMYVCSVVLILLHTAITLVITVVEWMSLACYV